MQNKYHCVLLKENEICDNLRRDIYIKSADGGDLRFGFLRSWKLSHCLKPLLSVTLKHRH